MSDRRRVDMKASIGPSLPPRIDEYKRGKTFGVERDVVSRKNAQFIRPQLH